MIQHFGFWDYFVLVLVLLTSSLIGIYYRFTGGKQKTMQEYLLADRNMPIGPVAFSLMASFMSAITLLGVSSENYTFGVQFVVINISYALFTPVAAYLYLPVFFKLQATSAYEYLEKRFGQTSRLVASLCYSFQMILYMGIVLYAPALALEALTGISKTVAILSVGLVCTFYSTIGGMKAVLITDVFQSLLMFAAVFSVIICAIIDKGSIAEIWRIAEAGNRTSLLNFNPDPTDRHTWLSLILGGGIIYLSLYAVNQTQVQRYLTVKDLKTAQKALWLNWPILMCLSLTTSFSGLAIFSKYSHCDPVKAGFINNTDQLMPYYVVDSMGHIPGLSGLFVAGIFSASLSTVSAAVNSLAAVTIEDYYKPLYKKIYKKPLSESKASLNSKLIALLYGFVCLAVAFLAQFLGGLLQASLTIFGVIGGPLLGLFTLGMFTTRSNEKGSVCGLITGLCFVLWMAFGGPRPPLKTLPVSIDGCQVPILHTRNSTLSLKQEESEYFWLYRVSYMYNGVFGLVVTIVFGMLFSLVFSSPKQHFNPNLFIPPLARRLKKKYYELGIPLNSLTQQLDEIQPNLFLGSVTQAQNINLLKKHKISHILTINDQALSHKVFDNIPNLVYKFIKIYDMPNENILQFFDETNNFIEVALQNRGRVLVHCHRGVSRSAAFVIAFLMKQDNTTYDKAFKQVISSRIVIPNPGFVKQLQLYRDYDFVTEDIARRWSSNEETLRV